MALFRQTGESSNSSDRLSLALLIMRLRARLACLALRAAMVTSSSSSATFKASFFGPTTCAQPLPTSGSHGEEHIQKSQICLGRNFYYFTFAEWFTFFYVCLSNVQFFFLAHLLTVAMAPHTRIAGLSVSRAREGPPWDRERGTLCLNRIGSAAAADGA